MPAQLAELDVDLVTRGHLEKGLEALEDEFAGIFGRETMERFMAESLTELGPARIKNFVPLFVHRFARERLRALAQADDKLTKDVPEVRAADAVITMGCGDACPIYPGKLYEDWELEDPAGKEVETVRRIRDEIESRVTILMNRVVEGR
jgi:protein-tyrosine-phosphatase